MMPETYREMAADWQRKADEAKSDAVRSYAQRVADEYTVMANEAGEAA